MCNDWCFDWIQRSLPYWPENVLALEVGARDVNGSARAMVESRCASYIGVDIESGPGVDRIADVERLLEAFEREQFDVVLSTETVEHVRDWPAALSQMLATLKPGGLLILTTRSPGFELHGFPADHWRYAPTDMEAILSGAADILALESDVSYGYPCGVGVLAQKNATPFDESAWLARLRSEILLFHVQLGGKITFLQFEEIERSALHGASGLPGFPDVKSALALEDWRMRQAARADIMGIVSTEGAPLLVAPGDVGQSRIVSDKAVLRLRNPSESTYEFSLEIAQLPQKPPRLHWGDEEFAAVQCDPVGYHHRYRFDALLLPPDEQRLVIQPPEPNHALIRIHFHARRLSPDEAAWRNSPEQKRALRARQLAMLQRDRRIEELLEHAAHLEEALRAEQQHRRSVETHARNLEVLLQEAEKEAANHKALSAELGKHASNLEEQIRHHQAHIEALLAQVERLEDQARTSGGSSTQAIKGA